MRSTKWLMKKIKASTKRAEEKNDRQYAEQIEDYETMAWVLNEPCPNLTEEDYELIKELLDV